MLDLKLNETYIHPVCTASLFAYFVSVSLSLSGSAIVTVLSSVLTCEIKISNNNGREKVHKSRNFP